MSDLHQFEVHHYATDEKTGGAIDATTLIWAYTAQEAVYQYELMAKKYDVGNRYQGINFVRPALTDIRNATNQGKPHAHVCQECHNVVVCPLFAGACGCPTPERSELLGEPCEDCQRKKSHQHHCGICDEIYGCPQKDLCPLHNHWSKYCAKHTVQETLDFDSKRPASV